MPILSFHLFLEAGAENLYEQTNGKLISRPDWPSVAKKIQKINSPTAKWHDSAVLSVVSPHILKLWTATMPSTLRKASWTTLKSTSFGLPENIFKYSLVLKKSARTEYKSIQFLCAKRERRKISRNNCYNMRKNIPEKVD